VWNFNRENHFGGGGISGNNIVWRKGSFWFGRFWRTNYQLGIIYKSDNSMGQVSVLSAKSIWNMWIMFSCIVLILGKFGLFPDL
jgi:hypothetical protein